MQEVAGSSPAATTIRLAAYRLLAHGQPLLLRRRFSRPEFSICFVPSKELAISAWGSVRAAAELTSWLTCSALSKFLP